MELQSQVTALRSQSQSYQAHIAALGTQSKSHQLQIHKLVAPLSASAESAKVGQKQLKTAETSAQSLRSKLHSTQHSAQSHISKLASQLQLSQAAAQTRLIELEASRQQVRVLESQFGAAQKAALADGSGLHPSEPSGSYRAESKANQPFKEQPEVDELRNGQADAARSSENELQIQVSSLVPEGCDAPAQKQQSSQAKGPHADPTRAPSERPSC